MIQRLKHGCASRNLFAISRVMNGPAQFDPLKCDRRSAPRISVMFAATLEHDGQSSTVRVVNLSKTGSSISGDVPAKDSSMTLRREGVAVPARVIWASDDRAGLAFSEAIDVRGTLRAVPQRRAYHSECAGKRPPVGGCILTRAEQEKMHRCASLLGISLRETSV